MKTTRFFLLAWLGAIPMASPAAPETVSAGTGVQVNFFEPENFTDVKDSPTDTGVRDSYLGRLRDHLVKAAARFLPPGCSLAVTFTNLDMAGEFEPWLGPEFRDIRIVRDHYPPHAVLHFQLVDSEGNVVKEGRRELRDTGFMMAAPTGFHGDPLRYEKAMLDGWLHAEFATLRGP